jgi:hypothetical protein
MWMRENKWVAVETMASYKNISAGVPVEGTTIGIDSRWSFTERVKVGGPVDVLLAMLPNLGTIFPALPPPPTAGVGLTHPYIFGAFHQDDISESLGLGLGRSWRIKGGFGLGVMQSLGKSQLNPNGSPVVLDLWAEYIPPSSSVSFGVPKAFDIKTNAGRETRFGISVLF